MFGLYLWQLGEPGISYVSVLMRRLGFGQLAFGALYFEVPAVDGGRCLVNFSV
jgi:hypothetical protein